MGRFRLRDVVAGGSLTIYLTLGYPSGDVVVEAVGELSKLGVNLLEFGIPYHTPKYDGPTIRRSHARALSNGFGYLESLELLKGIGFRNQFLLTYYEMAREVGVEMFFREVSKTNVKAVLFPDLLIEYPEELARYNRLSDEYGFDRVYFVSSTFPHHMIAGLVGDSPSFVYMGLMASTGVALPVSVGRNIKIIKSLLNDIPVIGGFAIRSAEQVSQYIEAGVDGVVIGSAVVRILEKAINSEDDWKGSLRSFITPILNVLKR